VLAVRLADVEADVGKVLDELAGAIGS
jgi:hypothetical protein